MNLNNIRRFLVSSLLLTFLVACEKPQAPAMQAPVPNVTVVTLQAQAVTLTRQLPGRTSASVVAEVRPQVTGIVKERLFTEGSFVQAGQPLYQLDDATYRADYNSAQAQLERAKASVDIARYNAERAEKLIGTKAISQQDVDEARAELRQAEADVGIAEARVDAARVELDYARITSPIDGHIGKSTVTQGALVTKDQSAPLATVQQLDPIYVDLTRSASELLDLRRALSSGAARKTDGIPVSIILEDGTEYAYQGQLAFTDVAVDPTTGSYALRVVVPNPEQLLMPGMYVRATVSNAVVERGLLVPQRGVARDAKGAASAMVVTSDNTVEQRAVKVSRTIGDQWLVDGGLLEGDRVVIEGLQRIHPGISVMATEAEPAGAPQTSESGGSGE